MEKLQTSVDFEHQDFDNLGVNPYEIVIAVSKAARDVNDKAQKYLGPGVQVNPVILALDRLSRNEGFTYGQDVPGSAENGEPES